MGGCGILLTAALVDRNVVLTPGAAAAPFAPIENVIARNHIHHCGIIHKYVSGIHLSSRPATMANAPGNRIENNHIHHLPRNGIFAFMHQGGNVFAANNIHDVLLESDDGGAIHICASSINTRAQTIQGNRIERAWGAFVGNDNQAVRSKGFGIYLDDLTSHCTVTQNLVIDSSMGAVYIHGGQNNLVENNILVDDAINSLLFIDINSTMRGNQVRRNLVVCAASEGDALLVQGATAETTLAQCDQNLYWAAGKPITMGSEGFAAWQRRGFDTHSLVADPKFRDARNGDFALLPDSPAFALGFRPW